MSAQHIQPLVNVTGEGSVSVKPDGVDIRVRVESEGKETLVVKRDNDLIIDSVLSFLSTQDVQKSHVQSAYINLNKNFDYNTKTYHYTANQSLVIQLKDLKQYEPIMSGLLASGINRIEGVQFTASEMSKHNEAARILAIKDAQQRAQAYAEALGQTIGKAVQISEHGAAAPQPPMLKSRMMSAESSSNGETIAAGELKVTVKISASFELF